MISLVSVSRRLACAKRSGGAMGLACSSRARALALASLLAAAVLSTAPSAAAAAAPTAADYAALQGQVREVQDRLEIQQLLIEYGHLLDTHDLVGYSNLFAKEGEWIGGFGRAKGPQAILAMMNKYIGTAPFDIRNVKGFHLLTNMIVHVHGDRATAWSRIVYMVRNKDDKPTPAMGGHYDDTLIREDGHWKFLQRVVMMEIPFQDPREIKGEPPPAPIS
jgi:SnoaL-like domain